MDTDPHSKVGGIFTQRTLQRRKKLRHTDEAGTSKLNHEYRMVVTNLGHSGDSHVALE